MNNLFNIFLYSFIITLFFLIILIPFFRKKKVSQSIRKEGPSSHMSKSGTPTMGGIIIVVLTIIIFTFLLIKEKLDLNNYVLLVYPLLSYSLIGFIDDSLIIKLRKNDGIKPKYKFIFQVIFGIIYCVLLFSIKRDTKVNIFNYYIDLKWFYGLLVVFMLVATSNAVNLTDGLDGLVSGNLIIILIALGLLSYKKNIEITYFTVILIGCILGFLCYNFHPAKLFMGDIGSLSLGASIASIFIVMKMEILLMIFGFVFILETLSVILQVSYFKKTNGKRLFLMTPIHHHFEMKGLKEWQIDLLFWVVTLIMATIGLFLGYKFY